MKPIDFLKVAFALCVMLLLSGQSSMAQTFCISDEDTTDQVIGVRDGYRYELWSQNAQGKACMTVDSGALFTAEWTDIKNYLARRGLGYDMTQTHREIGAFHATYHCNYNPNCASGNSYMGVYGWTYDEETDDLIEYYIIENWCNWIPSMHPEAESMGTFSANGSDYEIIRVPRSGAPSIMGVRDFMQYFSIRQQTRNSGSIDISGHFERWEERGMPLGKMYEVTMLVEGYQNSGSAEFAELDVSVDKD